MSNLLQHPQFGSIRVEKQGADFIFCAKDVCDVLEHTNARVAIQALDEDERCKKSLRQVRDDQNREVWFITESGLYALIIRSNKPMARKFRKWITSEVLPSLRKYGTYSTDEKVMDRVKAKATAKKVKELLTAIGSRLSATDKRLVARQCLTDEYEVWDVLDGRKQDAHMVALMYARATGNKLLRESFYTLKGAEDLLTELRRK